MNYNLFGPNIEADAHLNLCGFLEKVVVHHPKHVGRFIEIPGDWYDGLGNDRDEIVKSVANSLNGARVKIA